MSIVTDHADGVTVEIKVRPRAGRCRVAGVSGDRLVVEVKSAPERGKATQQALTTLARAVGARADDASLLKGARDRRKTVLLRGVTRDDCKKMLEIE